VASAYPYKRDKFAAVGQGIDTELFSRSNSKVEEQPPIILCVGRLSPVKNHPTLMKAARLLKQRYKSPFRVVIVGGPAALCDESYVRSLREQVHELGLNDMVEFAGPVNMKILPSWYRRSTVVVNMTGTGSGDKVVWEAMACGRLCVVANEGFKQTLGDYADRLSFSYGNSEELAERLAWVLSLSPDDLDSMGAYLRGRVVSMHGLERLATTIVELFESITARTGTSEIQQQYR
jgi:glycosyltransferase involved in cell wall biosynthesis